MRQGVDFASVSVVFFFWVHVGGDGETCLRVLANEEDLCKCN
jgi:hypothetical protein